MWHERPQISFLELKYRYIQTKYMFATPGINAGKKTTIDLIVENTRLQLHVHEILK